MPIIEGEIFNNSTIHVYGFPHFEWRGKIKGIRLKLERISSIKIEGENRVLQGSSKKCLSSCFYKKNGKCANWMIKNWLWFFPRDFSRFEILEEWRFSSLFETTKISYVSFSLFHRSRGFSHLSPGNCANISPPPSLNLPKLFLFLRISFLSFFMFQ